MPSSLVEGVFNAFDENRDDNIDFKEMACGISAACRGPIVERLKFSFKIFDLDRDGTLSAEEIGEMVRAIKTVRITEGGCARRRERDRDRDRDRDTQISPAE